MPCAMHNPMVGPRGQISPFVIPAKAEPSALLLDERRWVRAFEWDDGTRFGALLQSAGKLAVREAEMVPYAPLDKQLIALQLRLLGGARDASIRC